jgi:beta-1,4-glucosyltransferase
MLKQPIPYTNLSHVEGQTSRKNYRGEKLDKPLALILMTVLLPLFLINSGLAILSRQTILKSMYKTDAFGRTVILHSFNCGWLLKSAYLFDLLKGSLGFCGISMQHSFSPYTQLNYSNQYNCRSGLFSLYSLHHMTGLAIENEQQLLEKQLNGSYLDYLLLIIKSVLCFILYGKGKEQTRHEAKIRIFNHSLANVTMQQAVNWVTSESPNETPQLGFFINAHSINLSLSNPAFHRTLNQADTLFADGSGIRMAAKTAGYSVKENTNGTDMLPHLCQACEQQGKSIYLLGAKPGTAQKAAANLQVTYPNLKIAGVQHGYMPKDQIEDQIAQINASGCHVLLVAMGSPIQESWLVENQAKLRCQTALAVGGLFDFYSGQIKRSPVWIRELGLEWVWRLMQEPLKKFKRYVIGTPLFLFHVFILNAASKGAK